MSKALTPFAGAPSTCVNILSTSTCILRESKLKTESVESVRPRDLHFKDSSSFSDRLRNGAETKCYTVYKMPNFDLCLHENITYF